MNEMVTNLIDVQLFDLKEVRDELLRQLNEVELEIEKLETRRKRYLELTDSTESDELR